MYHIDHKGSMLFLNDCVLLTKHLVCNLISTQTSHQVCCKISLYLRKASIVILLPHTHVWHTLSGIDEVKTSNFCFIFDNRFLRLPENPRMMWTEEARAESTRAVLRAVKNSCKAGWELVTFTTAWIALAAALVAHSGQQGMPLAGCQAGKQQHGSGCTNCLTCWELLVTILNATRGSSQT